MKPVSELVKGLEGINRNIVECKYRGLKYKKCKSCELIETLWNVNVSTHNAVEPLATELIETLWNVNMEVRFPNGSRIMN